MKAVFLLCLLSGLNCILAKSDVQEAVERPQTVYGCTATLNGYLYDLSPLTSNVDYTMKDPTGMYEYHFNPCAQINTQNCRGKQSSLCQRIIASPPDFNLGSFMSWPGPTWSLIGNDSSQGVALQFSGDTCNGGQNRITTLNLVCTPGAGKGGFVSVTENRECVYTLTFNTEYSCRGTNPPPVVANSFQASIVSEVVPWRAGPSHQYSGILMTSDTVQAHLLATADNSANMLQRFTTQMEYSYVPTFSKCQSYPMNETYVSFFAWLQHSSFLGQEYVQNQMTNVWRFNDTSSTLYGYISSTDNTVPVRFIRESSTEMSTTIMDFLSWKPVEADPSHFLVPAFC